jgi:hypothetical protein
VDQGYALLAGDTGRNKDPRLIRNLVQRDALAPRQPALGFIACHLDGPAPWSPSARIATYTLLSAANVLAAAVRQDGKMATTVTEGEPRRLRMLSATSMAWQRKLVTFAECQLNGFANCRAVAMGELDGDDDQERDQKIESFTSDRPSGAIEP